ncbi:Pycsar system effector family protein [Chryseolinea sp. H1M3-3]|uniref:Pycsar system effector family protein n=1 Tax=Chryseolinea sp. H1M3-3 TaxID=3034144 RepID=UPI0023EC9F69|nr:Pycsar system effector family protein [Chryseolinea sp. H1M3-3]
MDSEFIRQAKNLAEQVFKKRAFEKHLFHNYQHTQDVVDAVQIIGQHTNLNADEMESALVAAWLHDIGYEHGSKNHEHVSAQKAKDLLESLGAPQHKITDVTEAILATHMPQKPRSRISQVLCDADLYHLSTEQCQEKSNMLREEWKALGTKEMSNEEWVNSTIQFMDQHNYHTAYGQTVLEQHKRQNIKRLKKSLKPEISPKKYRKLEEEVEKLRGKLEKERTLKPDRGIETMFRTTSHNHIMLSQMVDSKASILITINSIILSVVVSVLIRKLEENSYLLIPTILLITVCLATMIFSILASRPNVSSGKFTREDIKNKQTNLLFFGNFHAMKVEDYEWGMREMMKDADYLYGSLIKDIYYLGKVLGRKYRFLRIAYSIFMYGFAIAILSFIIAFRLSAHASL